MKLFRAVTHREGFVGVGTRRELRYKRQGDDAQEEGHGWEVAADVL